MSLNAVFGSSDISFGSPKGFDALAALTLPALATPVSSTTATTSNALIWRLFDKHTRSIGVGAARQAVMGDVCDLMRTPVVDVPFEL